MDQSMFIKSITTDDQNRIIVSIQDQFQHFLGQEMIRNMLKDTAKKALGDDYIKLEVSPSTFRVTVAEGASERAVTVIKDEIGKNIDMALSFMNNMN